MDFTVSFIRRSLSGCMLIAAALCLPSMGRAQNLCIPQAIGVPGDPTDAPAWFSASTGPLDTDGYLDPRWNAALGVGHDGGEAHFRALRHEEAGITYLYVGLRAHADPQGSTLSTTDGDRVVIGLSNVAANQAYRITLRLNTTVASAAGTPDVITWDDASGSFTGRVAVEMFEHWNGSAWTPLETQYTATPIPQERPMLPSWLAETARLWVSCNGASCEDDGARWTLQLRIPLGAPAPGAGPVDDTTYAAGLPLTGDMRGFHRISTYGSIGTPIPIDVVMDYPWPQVEVIPGSGVYEPSPAPSLWPEVSVDPAATCAGSITVASHSAIRTDSAAGTEMIEDPANFVVRPTNNTGGDVENTHVTAALRIADWGSAIGDSPDWTPVCQSDPTNPASTPVATVVAGDELNLRCTWDVPDLCDYLDTGSCAGGAAPTHTAHQCILAQLTTAPGAGQLVFDREAYWNNMWLHGASEVVETAKVSVRGLNALGTGRDVYLYVETHNLPAPPDKPNPKGQRLQQPLDPKLARMYATGQLGDMELDQALPTYRVHVFHDTGKERDGAHILRAQPNFGLYLHHEGEFDGWKHELEAAGLQKLANNFYRVHIADDGVADVTVRVATVELPVSKGVTGGSGGTGGDGSHTDPGTTPPPWTWILLALILIALLVLWLRSRK